MARRIGIDRMQNATGFAVDNYIGIACGAVDTTGVMNSMMFVMNDRLSLSHP
jgi:hypothetical protein